MGSSSSNKPQTPLDRLEADLDDLPSWVGQVDDGDLGSVAIRLRALADRNEAVTAEVLRRLDKSEAYKDDGALSLASWLRWKCKLSAGAAMERVEVARQLSQLPKFEAALARGDIGYQHV